MNEKYKKYLVFAFDHYYPTGGLDDVRESFDSLEQAHAAALIYDNRADRVYVWDRIEDEMWTLEADYDGSLKTYRWVHRA